MERAALIERLRAALASHDGVRLALLFGSRARGDNRPESDVDLAVLGDVDRLRLAADVASALGLEVDVVSLEAPSTPLLRAVLRDAVCVREGTPGAWGSFLSHSLVDLDTDGPLFDRMQDAFVRRVAVHGLGSEGR